MNKVLFISHVLRETHTSLTPKEIRHCFGDRPILNHKIQHIA